MNSVVNTSKAPAAVGPYSQAISTGAFIFLSGQLPIDPVTGAFAPGGVQEQTRQSLTNVRAVLEEAGISMNDIVKTTVFLKDMNDFAAMNEIYSSFFEKGNYPARSAVQVAKLPKDALVEIEAIAKR